MSHLIRILALPLLLGACAQTVTPAPERIAANTVEGHRLAELHCARCHAIDAESESPHPMAPAFRRLSRDYPVNALEEAFAEGILVGHPEMPEFRFEPDQVDDLVAYIQSIQERRGG